MPARVLVVEDTPLLRTLLADLLELEGYVVDVAKHGAEALQIVAEHPPDIVLLDLMMPIMDGPAFLAAAQGQHWLEQAHIIILSASWRGKAIAEAHRLPHLPKPFDVEKLLATIASLLD